MRELSCVLLSKTYSQDENRNVLRDKNGREIFEINETEVPIISNEKVWKNEFYQANEQGLRPSLRLKISSLNYNNEESLRYMNQEYTIIRTDGSYEDEIVLICQRRTNNV